MVRGVSIVNRSVCLFGPLFCALFYFQFASLLCVSPPVSLFLILNKDRRSGHGGTLEFHGSQVLPFAFGSDMYYYESSLSLHVIQWPGGARLRKCFTP